MTMRMTQGTVTAHSNRMAPGWGRDKSGFAVFSRGQAGHAHVMAHTLLDQQRPDAGYDLLGQWLRSGDFSDASRSEYVHLQWHMAMFELQSGHWQQALDRFRRHIMPTSVHARDALTDAPALLWWLALLRPEMEKRLPWESLRAIAAMQLNAPNTPFVQIHNLLALAGAGDVYPLERYLGEAAPATNDAGHIIRRVATALHAYSTGDYRQAATLMDSVATRVAETGGSHAQNRLFAGIARHAAYRQALRERH